MKKTGELLKQKRESAKLSLSEVALATKINPKILTAIENGDEAQLPAKTFLKGFVRSYALFLKLDVDEVLRVYQEEIGGPAQPVVHEAYRQPEPGATPPARRRSPDESSAGLRTVAVVVIALLIGVIIGVRELIEKYQREKVVAPAEVKVSPLVTPPVQPQPLPASETPATDTAAKEKEAEKPAEKPPEPVKAEVAVPTPPPVMPTVGIPRSLAAPKEAIPQPAEVKPEPKTEAKSEPLPEPAKTEEAKAEPPKPEAKPETKPEAKPEEKPVNADLAKAAKNEIILEALDKVDVDIKLHGETKRVSLAPTQVHTIRTDGPLILDFSDGGAVNIILNGRERGVPGDLGKPKQVKLP
jgi:cytoskeleton protein RodZ